MKEYKVIVDLRKNDEAFDELSTNNDSFDENQPADWVERVFSDYEDAKAYVTNKKKIWIDEKLSVQDNIDSNGDEIYPPDCYIIREYRY